MQRSRLDGLLSTRHQVRVATAGVADGRRPAVGPSVRRERRRGGHPDHERPAEVPRPDAGPLRRPVHEHGRHGAGVRDGAGRPVGDRDAAVRGQLRRAGGGHVGPGRAGGRVDEADRGVHLGPGGVGGVLDRIAGRSGLRERRGLGRQHRLLRRRLRPEPRRGRHGRDGDGDQGGGAQGRLRGRDDDHAGPGRGGAAGWSTRSPRSSWPASPAAGDSVRTPPPRWRRARCGRRPTRRPWA